MKRAHMCKACWPSSKRQKELRHTSLWGKRLEKELYDVCPFVDKSSFALNMCVNTTQQRSVEDVSYSIQIKHARLQCLE
eukprot:39559-Pelagomonas_calceolata.AAC.1